MTKSVFRLPIIAVVLSLVPMVAAAQGRTPTEDGNDVAESESKGGAVLLGLECSTSQTGSLPADGSYPFISDVENVGTGNPEALKLASGLNKYF